MAPFALSPYPVAFIGTPGDEFRMNVQRETREFPENSMRKERGTYPGKCLNDTDKGIYLFFRRHYGEWFLTLSEVHRTTFARQAANLWKTKEALWQDLLALTPHDPTFFICDSMPLPACLFARAYTEV
jgi:hypothetical protein